MSTNDVLVRYNFAPGPAQLPAPVIEQAAEAIRSFPPSGRSLLELSHRSPAFEEIAQQSEADLRGLLHVSDDYAVLFLNGGARLHYGLWPLNISDPKDRLGMIHTGYWSEMASQEARRFRPVTVLPSNNAQDYPELDTTDMEELAYVHYVSNETLSGLAMPTPELPRPLVCDRTSDFLSEPFEVAPYALCYAGSQKTFGCAGLTTVLVRRELLRDDTGLPTGLDYATQDRSGCRYHTPATYAWYVTALYLRWIVNEGGLETMEQRARKRARRLYDCIDASALYTCTIAPRARSRMNVCFDLAPQNLYDRFLEEASACGLAGLRGHSTVGGIRASLYNAMPMNGVDTLVAFMQEFERTA